MTDKEYEQKKRECWEEFRKEHPEISCKSLLRNFVDFIFDRAYALGKNGKCTHPSVSHLENGKLVKGTEYDVSSCEDVAYEPNLAEPRFKVGDKVRLKDVYEIEEIDEDRAMVGLKGCAYMEDIDNLEPYTEPKEEADKQFDNILKDSFSKERRLNIATQMVSAYIHCEGMTDPSLIATIAFQLADALIAESKKEDSK